MKRLMTIGWLSVGMATLALLAVALSADVRGGPPGVLPSGEGPAAGAASRPITQTDREELLAFLKETSPNRYEALQRAGPAWTDEALRVDVERYRAYKELKSTMPDLAALRLKRFVLQDKLFAAMLRLRRGESGSRPTSRPTIDPEVLDIETKLVDLNIEEQQLKVDNLQKLLAPATRSLDYEQAHREEEIHKNAMHFMESTLGGRPHRGPGGGGPGGGGPGGWEGRHGITGHPIDDDGSGNGGPQ